MIVLFMENLSITRLSNVRALEDCPPFVKRDNFCDFRFAFLHPKSLGGEQIPTGEQSLSFFYRPSSEGIQTHFTELSLIIVYQFP